MAGEKVCRRLLALLLTAFVALGTTYGLTTPCFESPDEPAHLAVVRYIANHKTLPPPVIPSRPALTAPDVAWFLSYHDPPLYYAPPLYHALVALLISWTDMGDLPDLLVPSPIWEAGWSPEPNHNPWNKNIYSHLAVETLAQSGTVQAAYLLRLVSLGLGAVTVACAYALARLLWADRPALALGAAAIVALNPRFIALSAGVTNDSLTNALFGLSLVGAVRWMQAGADWDKWALLGGLVGLGLLTKQSALLLLPIGLLAVAWQRRSGPLRARKLLADGGAFLVAALGVGGWWYARNGLLYGDPLGLEPHLASQVPLARFGLDAVLMTLRSYWASFGWDLILVEPLVYAFVGLVALAALAGIVLAARPGGPLWSAATMTRRGLVLLGLIFLLNTASFVRWAIATGAPYGRLLFPSIAAVGVLVAWGLAQWTGRAAFRWGLCAVVGFALLFAALVPWCYLRPALASPRLPDGMPDGAQPVGMAFQEETLLAGYEPFAGNLEAGEELQLSLYWHTPTGLDARYRTWVQLGPQDPTCYVAAQDVWLGGTLYPSDLWVAHDTVRQDYRLFIPDWAPTPGLYWVRLGLVDERGERVALADRSGDWVALGPWRMLPATPPDPPSYPSDFRLGPAIHLLGYDLEQHQDAEGITLELALHWQAGQVPEVDHTVYVHLVDAEGHLLAQDDGPPRNGQYPTSWWLPAQVVVDRHTIHLSAPPTEAAWLRVGMYDPETMIRVPVYDGTGQQLPGDAIPLAEIVLGNRHQQ